MKKVYLLCILTCIVFSFNVYAQSWQPLGPTDTNQASFSEAQFKSIVVGSNGVPYIAFADAINNFWLSVRKFENGTWAYVGTPAFSTGVVHTPCLAIDGNNTPYVFYMEQGSTVGTVKKFNGSTWENVGSPADLSTGGAAHNISIAIDATNTPYVLYADATNSNLITVKKFDGSAWTNVGTPGFTTGSVNDIAFAIDGANTPYVAYQDPGTAQKITVKKFDGSAWVTVGTAGFSTGYVSNVSIAISPASNAPYVAYLDENRIANVRRFNGSFWQSYGTPSADWTDLLCLAVDAYGTAYVAYYNISNNNALVKKWSLGSWVNVGTAVGNRYVGNVAITTDVNRDPYIVYSGSFMHNKAVVEKFDGSNWVNLGTTGFSTWAVENTVIKLDGSNTPYVVYWDLGNDRITVKKYNRGSWVTVGTEGFTVAEAYSPDMAFDATGAPYVVYKDGANSNKATVQKFNGSTWDFVGTPGFSDRIASYAHIAIDGNNTPYVVYQDAPTNSANNIIVVKKFDGTNWVSVGTDGFSAGRVQYTDIAIHSDGTPYVAYQDWGNSRKLTVKKFDGSSWVTVGTEGFSTGSAEDIDIAFDGNNTLYVAYGSVSGNDLIPVVKKFDGNTWVDVGTVSTTGGYEISLAFNAGGTPYVAYTDVANNEKATVKKFDGTAWVDVGSQGFSAGRAESPSIAIGSNGNPIVVYGSGDVFAQTIIESTLPLHFVEFTGQLLKSNALLGWKTDNEENTKEFIVERSIDGHDYNSIGSVAAMNTAGVHQYNFIDNAITSLQADVVYYRLKQIDIDGNFTNSRIIALSAEISAGIELRYQNPVNNNAGFTITVDKPQQVQARLFNNTGRILKSQQWNLSGGSNSLSIDMSGLAKGIYYLDIKSNSINKQVSILKQ